MIAMTSGRDPKLTPTTIDIDSSTDLTDLTIAPLSDPPPPAVTQPESDPATAFVRRDSFVDLPPGSVVGEIYEIDAKIGAGAMGEVYAARHLRLGKRVAIKVIGPRLSEDAAAIDRFAQEARAIAQIQHPAIVAIDHVGELADGRAYFAMEYLRGESLYERLQRGRIPLLEAIRILDQMARGLEAAHAQGVVHRDLKPENTFLVHMSDEPPMVKLLDFGLAKLAATVDRRTERTQSGVAIGTPMYMSPEQARGPDVDHRTDIYALGIVAYELLLGQAPFPHARTAPEMYAAHLHEPPPLPRSIWPEIPPQLDLALFAMLAKDPTYRPTLAQVRSVLAGTKIATGTPSQRAATEIVAPDHVPKMKSGWTIVAAIAIALTGGIVIGTAVTSKSRGDRQREIPAITAPAITAPRDRLSLVPIVRDAAIGAIPTDPTPRAQPKIPMDRTPRLRVRPLADGSAAIAAPAIAPLDAGVDATIVDLPSPRPARRPIDRPYRDQTMDPFVKHQKVNP